MGAGALVDGGVETDIVNPVVRRKLKAVGPGGEGDCSVAAFTAQRLPGRKADRWRLGQLTMYNDLTDARVLCSRDQLQFAEGFLGMLFLTLVRYWIKFVDTA
jgi:hypothetical protein